MPRLLFFYLARRLALSAAIVEAALCVPVVLSYLLDKLPAAAVRGGLVLPAMEGVTPTIAYVALPMAMGLSTALTFSNMASEGMIAVLYALRLSVFAIIRPALALAAALVVAGYALSNFIAPFYNGKMQDVLNVIHNSLNHRMLEPAHFYTFDNGAKNLYFERWETPDVAANLMVHMVSAEKMEDQTITAARAEFRRVPAGVVLALTNGTIQTKPLPSGDVRLVTFDQHALALPMQGSGDLPQRSWHGLDELSASDFFARFGPSRADHHELATWATEAAMRLGVPLLALGHTLLAVALGLRWGNVTGRRGAGGAWWTIAALPAAHIGFLVALQSLLRADARFALLLATLAALEIGISAVILARLNFALKPRRLF
ncbi:MAG TPA: LptF/LptG family permease [Methylocystis sp.]|nr:LptF/LptG family permease [Methylocystis sp.]